MSAQRVAVVGAGIGGLAAALALAADDDVEVTVLERAPRPGGKLREAAVGGRALDAGPTVFTMRWVFDELLAPLGERLDDHLVLQPAQVLARHAWDGESRLDLHADLERSVEAIGDFAGAPEARRFRAFSERAAAVYGTLEAPFLRRSRPNPVTLAWRAGWRGLPGLLRIDPFSTLWQTLGAHFHDPRLRQLFGRYATYCGASPFLAPATLMLVAHVERAGVWCIDGGMARLVDALAGIAARRGVTLRCGAHVQRIVVERGRACGVELDDGERIDADAVVFNGDAAALGAGLLGGAARTALPRHRHVRSLSALTWSVLAPTRGFPLVRHNVFFGADSAREFEDLFDAQRLPADPTVYVCAQDRGDPGTALPAGAERLLCLVNAPARGDTQPLSPEEIETCEQRTFARLARCGLAIERSKETCGVTTPSDFDRRFPATGGALYGPASHGWQASFRRPTQQTAIPGLVLCGGSTHPGPGVPMAALSGRLAAQAVLAQLARRRVSMSTSPLAATLGGTSMR